MGGKIIAYVIVTELRVITLLNAQGSTDAWNASMDLWSVSRWRSRRLIKGDYFFVAQRIANFGIGLSKKNQTANRPTVMWKLVNLLTNENIEKMSQKFECRVHLNDEEDLYTSVNVKICKVSCGAEANSKGKRSTWFVEQNLLSIFYIKFVYVALYQLSYQCLHVATVMTVV